MKIFLINMPFMSVKRPSIALTQLGSVVRREFGDLVNVKLLYLNLHLANDMGVDAYSYICDNMTSLMTGFGDWFFRKSAFPQLPDNAGEYFSRYGPQFPKAFLEQFHVHGKPFRDGLNDYLDGLIDLYKIGEANLVGFTSMFSQTMASTAMAGRLKARNPDLVTIIGGANAEGTMGIELAHHLPNIDYVFSGPALRSFPRLVDCLLRSNREDAERIDGVFTKKNTRSIVDLPVTTSARADECQQLSGIRLYGQELDINAVVDLDYDSFVECYEQLIPPGPVYEMEIPFETSRGCWWGQKAHCTFCGLNGLTMNYRFMETDKALDLLHGLFARYSQKNRLFFAVDNILPREYLSGLLGRLRVPPHVSLFYEIKADLKKDDFKTLAKAHVLTLQPGIEALSSSTLRLMRKGTTAFTNIQFLGRAARYGINLLWNLLIGFPGEEARVYEKYLKDLPLLMHLTPPVGVYPVRFDRFSPYFDRAADYKLDLRPLDFYSLNYPFSEGALRNMAHYFYDNNVSADYCTAYRRYIKELEALAARWQMRWYGRDNRPPACLQFKTTGSNVIIDTRDGEILEFALDEREMAILTALEEPLDFEILKKKCPQVSSLEVQETLQSLTSRNLLFSESGRWLSLVFTREAIIPSD